MLFYCISFLWKLLPLFFPKDLFDKCWAIPQQHKKGAHNTSNVKTTTKIMIKTFLKFFILSVNSFHSFLWLNFIFRFLWHKILSIYLWLSINRMERHEKSELFLSLFLLLQNILCHNVIYGQSVSYSMLFCVLWIRLAVTGVICADTPLPFLGSISMTATSISLSESSHAEAPDKRPENLAIKNALCCALPF